MQKDSKVFKVLIILKMGKLILRQIIFYQDIHHLLEYLPILLLQVNYNFIFIL
jgi:hypothetical protein